MAIEIIKTIVIGAFVVFVSVFVYVQLLLGIARLSAGNVKLVLSMIVYLAMCVVLMAALIFLIDNAGFAHQDSMWAVGYTLAAYAAILALGLYYLVKVKKKELERAGYFLSRHRRKY